MTSCTRCDGRRHIYLGPSYLVSPVTCPHCGGSGHEPPAIGRAEAGTKSELRPDVNIKKEESDDE